MSQIFDVFFLYFFTIQSAHKVFEIQFETKKSLVLLDVQHINLFVFLRQRQQRIHSAEVNNEFPLWHIFIVTHLLRSVNMDFLALVCHRAKGRKRDLDFIDLFDV